MLVGKNTTFQNSIQVLYETLSEHTQSVTRSKPLGSEIKDMSCRGCRDSDVIVVDIGNEKHLIFVKRRE